MIKHITITYIDVPKENYNMQEAKIERTKD